MDAGRRHAAGEIVEDEVEEEGIGVAIEDGGGASDAVGYFGANFVGTGQIGEKNQCRRAGAGNRDEEGQGEAE